jgi:hypothetical protein
VVNKLYARERFSQLALPVFLTMKKILSTQMQLPLILQSLTAAIAITDGTGRLQSPAARVATDCLGARWARTGDILGSRQTSLLEPMEQVGGWTFQFCQQIIAAALYAYNSCELCHDCGSA